MINLQIEIDKKVILASRSPRRIELLKMIFSNFDVIPSNFDESTVKKRDCTALVRQLALMKAKSVLNSNMHLSDSLIIGCDTLVSYQGEIFGIPVDKSNARLMMQTLSGNIHSVSTGVCLLYDGESKVFHSETKVKFHELSANDIEKYIATNDPYDKAGGYGVQSLGGLFVEKIDGDYYNVVGLPIAKLYREIKELI